MKKFIYALTVVGTIVAIVFSCTAPLSLNDDDVAMDYSPFGRDGYRAMVRDHNYAPKKIDAARKSLLKQFNNGASNEKDAGLGQWESLGPTEIGGRVRAIATHPTDPDILWVGGVSGGLWNSTDRGANWVPKGDLLPSLAITSILIHPTMPDTMYALSLIHI